jgi:putative flippase GtrA
MKSLVRRDFALFLCIGLGATAAHVAVATYLIGTHMMSLAVGNAIAFVFANVLSYLLQSAYVFQRAPTPVRYWRFLSVSLAGLAMVVAISSVLGMLQVHYLVSIVAVVSIVPFLTFLVHRVWTFQDRSEAQARGTLNHFARAGRWTA